MAREGNRTVWFSGKGNRGSSSPRKMVIVVQPSDRTTHHEEVQLLVLHCTLRKVHFIATVPIIGFLCSASSANTCISGLSTLAKPSEQSTSKFSIFVQWAKHTRTHNWPNTVHTQPTEDCAALWKGRYQEVDMHKKNILSSIAQHHEHNFSDVLFQRGSLTPREKETAAASVTIKPELAVLVPYMWAEMTTSIECTGYHGIGVYIVVHIWYSC